MAHRTTRRNREAGTVAWMITIYCHAHRQDGKSRGGPLCESCNELLRYAHGQIEECVHGEGKPTCRKCTIHCYDAGHRARIRAVMRFAGPRMLFRHPLAVLRHALR